jgi:hypothetical protein
MSQLFTKQHYAAFDQPKPTLDTTEIRAERERV